MKPEVKPEEHLIPPKSHVYLDGPKSRSFELSFAFRVFWQFIRALENFILLDHALQYLVQQDLKRAINSMKQQENFGKRFPRLWICYHDGWRPRIMDAAYRGAFEMVESPSVAIFQIAI
jgi:hypothetical protein